MANFIVWGQFSVMGNLKSLFQGQILFFSVWANLCIGILEYLF